MIPNTYIPEHIPVALEAPCPVEEEQQFAASSSDSSLFSSLSSNDAILSESEDNEMFVFEDGPCGDPFAYLDAAYEAKQPSYSGNGGLMRCGFSLYSSSAPSYDDLCSHNSDGLCSVQDESSECPLDGGAKRVGEEKVSDAQRTLQKTKRMSTGDLQRIIDLCKEMSL